VLAVMNRTYTVSSPDSTRRSPGSPRSRTAVAIGRDLAHLSAEIADHMLLAPPSLPTRAPTGVGCRSAHGPDAAE
jgi:hypothetical protein